MKDRSGYAFGRAMLLGAALLAVAGLTQAAKTPAAHPASYGAVTTERLLHIAAEPGAWLTGGRDYQQSYYSPLTSISADNVGKLGFAWQQEIDTNEGFESTPIVVDGVMYASGPRGSAFALNAKTGQRLWSFNPTIDLNLVRKVCCGTVNRGVTVWQGKVYVASLDGYLYALDAKTGKTAWKADSFIDRTRGYTSTGAPYIAGDLVLIGNSGAEYDARGYVSAYDVNTGKLRWRFFTVPGDPAKGYEHPELAMAAKTWDPHSRWDVGGGGTAWDGMGWDPKLNLVYIGTGNGGPHPVSVRSPAGGDNLFLSSILALDIRTGRLVWYYQTTPGDSWDYTATQKMILADVMFDGRLRHVIMQAPKNGFFYMLDRATGELLSAKPYTTVTWADGVDMKTGRPNETAQGDYAKAPKLVFPSMSGGHNWYPMSYNPGTGLVYIPTMYLSNVFAVAKGPLVYKKGGSNVGHANMYVADEIWSNPDLVKHLPPLAQLRAGQPDPFPRGFLTAWDPVKQRAAWRVETSGAWAGKIFATFNGGGVMSTASNLLFQARGSGDLAILDARTGAQLRMINVGTSLSAAPMTYSVDGEQYVAFIAGVNLAHAPPADSGSGLYGNKGRIIALKLGGGPMPVLPRVAQAEANFPKPPIARSGADTTEIEHGGDLFRRNCSQCHRNIGGTGIPDLRRMSAATHAEFYDIVLRGKRQDKGMGSFAGLLTDSDAKAIHAFLTEEAWKAYEQSRLSGGLHAGAPTD